MEPRKLLKILIADDHPLVRRGLAALLRDHFAESEIAEAGTASAALDVLGDGEWDLVLADINMPGRSGLELLDDLKRIHPSLPVLVISAHLEEDYAMRALKLGAAGYVSKQTAPDVLVAAVKKVLSGGRHVSPAVAEKLAMAAAGDWVGAPHETLSHRELQVLQMIAGGQTIKQIAAELALSEKTVATYRGRISVKLSLSTNVELTRYAIRHGLAD
jgi:two-component system, NarL family, invasion response regulator UvrY